MSGMKKVFVISIMSFFILNSFSVIANDDVSSTEEVKLLDPYLKEDSPFIRTMFPLRVYVNKETKELSILNYNINGLKLKINDEEYYNLNCFGKSIINLSGYLPGKYTIEFTDYTDSKYWIGIFEL